VNKVKHYFKWVTSKRYRKYTWLRNHLSTMRAFIHIVEGFIGTMDEGQLYRLMHEGSQWKGKRVNRAILSRARELLKEV